MAYIPKIRTKRKSLVQVRGSTEAPTSENPDMGAGFGEEKVERIKEIANPDNSDSGTKKKVVPDKVPDIPKGVQTYNVEYIPEGVTFDVAIKAKKNWRGVWLYSYEDMKPTENLDDVKAYADSLHKKIDMDPYSLGG